MAMNFEKLIQNLQLTHDTLLTSASKAVNTAMTVRNWLYGYYIVEYEQNGEDRAKYGARLLKELAENIPVKGISETNLRIFRQFYLTYPAISHTLSDLLKQVPIIQAVPEQFAVSEADTIHRTLSDILPEITGIPIRQTVSDKFQVIDIESIQQRCKKNNTDKKLGIHPSRLLQTLSFSHFVELLKIDDPLKRAFYEIECVQGTWSVRELQRQIESLYFERSGLSKDKKKLSEMVRMQAVRLTPRDVINNPFTIEFLGLNQRALVTESDLEQALLDHLQEFLLELGYGFCFEARQKRILIDGEYYFIDLVFYHRILKCHILVDLTIEKFKHSHAGKINAYLNYFREEVMQEGDNPPVGILLCTDKGETMAKYATSGLEHSVFVQKYQLVLPSKEELEQYIQKELND
jgi:predicted nuclease of restriction endonuclease-like (RecB) superfamily